MKTMNATVASAAPGVLGLGGTVAHAEMALDVVTGTTYVRGTFANFGYSFDVTEPVRVDALGLWDRFGDGLADEHQVGLWDADGNLLSSALVDNNSALIASVNTSHGWRFTSIAAIDLEPGTYKLAAYYPTANDAFVGNGDGTPVQITLAPQLNFGQSFVTVGGTEFFTEPDAPSSTTPGFFGPNANFSPIPEPATLAGLMILGTFGLRRRG